MNEFRFKLLECIETHDEISKEMKRENDCRADFVNSVLKMYSNLSIIPLRHITVYRKYENEKMTIIGHGPLKHHAIDIYWYLIILQPPSPKKQNKTKQNKNDIWRHFGFGRKQHFISSRGSYEIDRLI